MDKFLDFSNVHDRINISDVTLGLTRKAIVGKIVHISDVINQAEKKILFFSFVMRDDSGSIKVTLFGEDGLTIRAKIKVGNTYMLSNFNVKNKYHAYNTTNHKYEIVFENYSRIEVVPVSIIKLGEYFAEIKPNDEEEATSSGSSKTIMKTFKEKEIPPCIGTFVKVKTLPIPKLLIKDILQAESISLTKTLDIFQRYNIRFERVMCFGMVIANFNMKSRKGVTLDDGSATIPTIPDDEIEQKHKKMKKIICNKYKRYHEIPKDIYKVKPEIVGTAKILKFASKTLDSIPNLDSVKIGDDLIVIGRLSQWNNKRYMFAKKFFKLPDVQTKLDYLQDLFRFYNAAGIDI